MAETLIFDTTFLIDFQRERSRGDSNGPAHSFLQANQDVLMQLPITVLGEFAEGFTDRHDPVLEATLQHFELLPIGPSTAFAYGKIVRDLRSQGLLIGANDLWIAATAVAAGRRVVTRNRRDFSRIAGLQVAGY